MSVAKDIILIWTGAHSSIPAGFSRETTLDDKYPKATANAVDPNVTGGAAIHSHTSPTHSHILGDHAHTYTLSDVAGGGSTDGTDNGANHIMACEHYHTGTSGSRSAGTTTDDAVTYGSVSNDPPFHAVIFIKSLGNNYIPNSVSVLWNESSAPDGFGIHDGSGTTPDLRNKYLKGASANADAGDTGGSLTNVHNIDHSHTAQAHSHVAAASGAAQGYCWRGGSGTAASAYKDHTHDVILGDATQAINSFVGSLTTAETVEPAYKKLMAIKNISGSPKLPKGSIALWLGELSKIPLGWNLCDGNKGTPDLRDKFIKIANSSSELGNTGGSNTHTHAAQSHSHTSPSAHTHTGSTGNHVTTNHNTGSGSVYDQYTGHTTTSVSNATANYDPADTTADSASNQPPFRTVAYIQFEFSPAPAGILTFI
jgi:hypothetical protein